MVTAEQVLWGYRLLLEREPESNVVIEEKLKSHSIGDLISSFVNSTEFQEKHPTIGSVRNQWVMIEHQEGFRIWVNLADLAVSGAIMKNEFERPEIAFVRQAIKPNNTVLDIGTNIGFFSLLFSALVGRTGRVIGFEPLSFLYEAAVKSARENGFSQCTIHNMALADERGTAKLIYAPGSTNWGGAFLSFDGVGLADHASVDVPIAPLSDFVVDVKADFIKIDVEGAEYIVLQSCRDYIQQTKPIIMSEIHRGQLDRVSNVSPSTYIQLITEIGYTCKQINQDGNLGQVITGQENMDLINVAFIPQ